MDFTIKDMPGLQYGSIYCIGRNYASHIREMRSERTDEPVVFLKPRSSLIFDGDSIKLPSSSTNVHHEVELVVLIGKQIAGVQSKEAIAAVAAIGVGIDVTARDIQSRAKLEGLPWTLAKGFDTFAPLGNLATLTPETDLQDLEISIKVNGEIRQKGNTSQMLFKVPEVISYLSGRFTLYPGDLIFTGTPQGVSRLNRGDYVEAVLGDELSTLSVHVS
jgi:2-keto-4-pentenoate hydratase/2-oxohepta-3-ene-1,7-dioic acid hydratase in catechol pathway